MMDRLQPVGSPETVLECPTQVWHAAVFAFPQVLICSLLDGCRLQNTDAIPDRLTRRDSDRLGRTSKMGQRYIRRLPIVGAIVVARLAARKGAPEGTWLGRMMARKPKMLVAVALANRMAHTARALLRKGEDYRDPAMAAV